MIQKLTEGQHFGHLQMYTLLVFPAAIQIWMYISYVPTITT